MAAKPLDETAQFCVTCDMFVASRHVNRYVVCLECGRRLESIGNPHRTS